MNPGRTPNYMLSEPYRIDNGPYDSIILPTGTFVRPVKLEYVPPHVLEDKRWQFFNSKYEVFVYCRYGFIVVPKKIVRGE